LVDLGHAVGDGEVHHLGALIKALAVLGELEDLPAVGPLALEYGAGIVQGMAQHVDVGLAPGNEPAVQPDETVAVVIGRGVDHATLLLGCLLQTGERRSASTPVACASNTLRRTPGKRLRAVVMMNTIGLPAVTIRVK